VGDDALLEPESVGCTRGVRGRVPQNRRPPPFPGGGSSAITLLERYPVNLAAAVTGTAADGPDGGGGVAGAVVAGAVVGGAVVGGVPWW
jgi:hypothetical protein